MTPLLGAFDRHSLPLRRQMTGRLVIVGIEDNLPPFSYLFFFVPLSVGSSIVREFLKRVCLALRPCMTPGGTICNDGVT